MMRGNWAIPTALLVVTAALATVAAVPSLSSSLDWVGRFHPVLLHLPIGLLAGAALLECRMRLRRGDPLRPAAAWLWYAAALGVTLAAATGWILAREGGYDASLLTTHRLLGVGLALVSVAAAIAHDLWRRGGATPAWPRGYPVLLLLCLGLLPFAGHFGGSLTHGPDYLVEKLPWAGRERSSDPAIELAATDPPPFDAMSVFQQRCVSCHGPSKHKGGLRLDGYEHMLTAGRSGRPAVVPGQALQSEVVRRVVLPAEHPDAMPADGSPLTDEQIVAVIRWIDAMQTPATPEPRVTAVDQPAESAEQAIQPVAIAEDDPFTRQILPVLQQNCYRCHDSRAKKGGVDLSILRTAEQFRGDAFMLEHVRGVLADHVMPPESAPAMPDPDRKRVIDWIDQTVRDMQAENPNDPGRVVMARLNHHQYRHVINDLTGVPIDTSLVFPMTGGGPSGFPNDGEAHTATVQEVEKFFLAAKFVVSHARVTPGAGITWTRRAAEKRGLSRDDMIEEIVFEWGNRLQGAYERAFELASPERAGGYLMAAWEYEHRAALGRPDVTIAEVTRRQPGPLAAPVVGKWHALLTKGDEATVGRYLAWVAQQWRALPAPPAADPQAVRDTCEQLGRSLSLLASQGGNGAWAAYQPFETYTSLSRRDRGQFDSTVTREGRYAFGVDTTKLPEKSDQRFVLVVSPAGDASDNDVVWVDKPQAGPDAGSLKALDGGVFRRLSGEVRTVDGKLLVRAPAAVEVAAPAGAAVVAFDVQVHPQLGKDGVVQLGVYPPDAVPDDLSVLPGRRLVYLPGAKAAKPLEQEAKRLNESLNDRQWNIGRWRAPQEVAEDPPELLRPEPMGRLRSPLDKLRMLDADEVMAMLDDAARLEMEGMERRLADAYRQFTPAEQEQAARRIIAEFARKAWRGRVEEPDLQPLYAMFGRALADGDSFDAAVKLPMTAILAHPRFMYLYQRTSDVADRHPLSGVELACRLSFTIWNSMPDAELMELAERGALSDPAVVRDQARRMLADEKGRRLAEDFAGYWLGFVGFDEYASVDMERFEQFTPELRAQMYEEVLRFMDGVIRGGRPVTDVIDADYAWLNEPLAAHYGVPGVRGAAFRRVPLPADSPRGGLVTTAAILTKTSKPLRTSPVVRGDWVLEELLGERIPPPPDDVPLLSDDSVDDQGRTLLEQLQVHRDNPSCRSCHEKMDPVGVALENFDPIGRWRTSLREGVPVVNAAPLPDGTVLDGVAGLKRYLKLREADFVDNLCRKFLAYALGRTLQPTDHDLLEAMRTALQTHDNRFDAMLLTVVESPQFRMRRDEPATALSEVPRP